MTRKKRQAYLRKGGKIMLYIVVLFVSVGVGFNLSKILNKK